MTTKIYFTVKNIFILCLLLCAFSATAQKISEARYTDLINETFIGEREYKVESGRVDILTETYAIEVERAYNWKQSIGQALWYALQTNKTPGIVLILEKNSDYKYFIQLNTALEYAGLQDRVKVWQFPQDFPEAVISYKSTITEDGEPTDGVKYWQSTNSGVRHNQNCKWFKRSYGEPCEANEGTACGICGG